MQHPPSPPKKGPGSKERNEKESETFFQDSEMKEKKSILDDSLSRMTVL